MVDEDCLHCGSHHPGSCPVLERERAEPGEPFDDPPDDVEKCAWCEDPLPTQSFSAYWHSFCCEGCERAWVERNEPWDLDRGPDRMPEDA